jgi:hypothetical protein
MLAGLACLLVAGGVTGAWAATRSAHGNADPGGHVLADLKTIERAIPTDANVMSRQANEPHWDSCDGQSGTFGWGDVTVYVAFRTRIQPDALIADADKALSAAGWRRAATLNTPLGPGARWSRTVLGTTMASATLAPGIRGDGTGTYWDLDAVAPPQGKRVSGC